MIILITVDIQFDNNENDSYQGIEYVKGMTRWR